MWLYRAIQLALRAAIHVYFRQIHVVGLEHVPREGEGPVLFAGNHPNSLIDPVLILCTSARITHFAAKDKLFAWPLGPLLRALGAVPIARKMDHGEGARDNNDAMAAMIDVLARSRAIGIFPEGLSHDGPHLERLRTGAARVALEAHQRHPEVRVQIVPTGLTYIHRKRMRSRALVQYGEPIVLDASWVSRWQQDPYQAARDLTDQVDLRLRTLTVNAPDWDTLRVLDGVRRLYQPRRVELEDRVELARRFCLVYPQVAHLPEVQQVYAEVAAYLDRLDGWGLADRDVVRGGDRDLSWRALGNLAGALVWLPLAVPSLPIHLPLGLLIAWAGLTFAPRKDVIGTSRLLAGLLLVVVSYLGLPVIAAVAWGPLVGLALALFLPLSGFATLRLVERGASLGRIARSAWAALALPQRIVDLRSERGRLESRVVELVARYKPADMPALFPREPASP